MLIDDYLSDYQVSYRHSIVIDAPAERVFPIVQKFDLSNAALLRFLFWIRSIPAKLKGQDLLGATLADLQKGGLLVLGTDSQHEFLLGFVGNVWSATPSLLKLNPAEFMVFAQPGFAKVVCGFWLTPLPNGRTLLETETRAQCFDETSQQLLRRYLIVFRPLSEWTRISALRAFKRQAERR